MCLFCSIVKGDIPADIVYQDQLVLAFKDINPVAPHHILIIPKIHIDSLATAAVEHADVLGHIQIVAAEIARELGVAENGYRLVLNCGKHGGQTVDHIHYHLIAGTSFGWPPFANDVPKQ